jgi:phosphoribosyl-AMP cyclohydrolase
MAESNELNLKFDDKGLITAVAQDVHTKEILMLAHMNQQAFDKTLETGEAHYWSRSRQELWHKGATSGAVQAIKDLKIDCDQDAVVLMIEQKGSGACHTGRRSCFYRNIGKNGVLKDNL